MRKVLLVLGSGAVSLLIALAILTWLLMPPSLKAPAQQDRIISNVTIWNPGETPTEHKSIVIADGLIMEIRDTREDDPEPLCSECYVMPGLIDAHIHTPPRLAIGNQRLFSLLYLKYGITAVRDLGQLDDSLPSLVARIKDGKIPGPRMYRCGPALDGTPAAFQGAVSLRTKDEGINKVAELASEGVDCIKVYDNLPPEAFIGVAAEANRQNLPLVGHTPHGVKLSQVRNFEIAHYTGVPYLQNDPPEGFAYLSQDLIDMTDQDTTNIITLMKEHNLSILPTNANVLARLTVPAADRFPASEGLKHLPSFWQKAWPNIVSHPETDEAIQTDFNAVPVALTFNRKAREAGVDVLIGTDVVMPYVIPGESLHLQIKMMADAFQSHEDALQAATHINGRHIDQGMVGRVQAGAYADLLIFEKDPRQDLSVIRNWTLLMSNGRLYERAFLDKAVAKYEQHFNGRLYTSVMNFIYAIIARE